MDENTNVEEWGLIRDWSKAVSDLAGYTKYCVEYERTHPLRDNPNQEDQELAQEIHDKIMKFASPDVTSGLEEAVTCLKEARGFLDWNESLMLEVHTSLTSWDGQAADAAREYLNVDLKEANRALRERIDALELATAAFKNLIGSMQKDLFTTVQDSSKAIMGGGGSFSAGKFVGEAFAGLATGGPSGIKDAVKSVLKDFAVAVFKDAVGDSSLDIYQKLSAALDSLYDSVCEGAERVQSAFDKVQNWQDRDDLAGKKMEPPRPEFVTNAFDPSEFMVADYIEVDAPATKDRPASHKIAAEYRNEIDTKINDEPLIDAKDYE